MINVLEKNISIDLEYIFLEFLIFRQQILYSKNEYIDIRQENLGL